MFLRPNETFLVKKDRLFGRGVKKYVVHAQGDLLCEKFEEETVGKGMFFRMKD